MPWCLYPPRPPPPPPPPPQKIKQNRSPKTTAQARPYFFPKQRACSLDTTFRLAIPVFLTLTDVIEFMTGIKYYVDGECRKKIKIV